MNFTSAHLSIEMDITVVDNNITVTNMQTRVVRNRETVTTDRLDQVRKLHAAGGVEAVARTLAVSRAQAYRLIGKSREDL